MSFFGCTRRCDVSVRRKFVDLHELHKSAVAAQMLDRIGALYAIEKKIRGQLPDERRAVRQEHSRAVRQEHSRPQLSAMKPWMEQTLATLSQKSATAKAISYALVRWEALQRFCDDGRIEINNNAAERALRCVALGRKNYLFAGSDAGGDRAGGNLQLVGHRQTQRATIQKSLCARSSRALLTIQLRASTSCCPGIYSRRPPLPPP